MKKAELVFIPSTGVGHVVTMVEMAKVLVDRHHRLSITVLIMQLPFSTKVPDYLHSLSLTQLNNNIKIVELPKLNLSPSNFPSRVSFIDLFIKSHVPLVKEAVSNLIQTESASGDSPRLAGFVLDMFCGDMIEVANDFGVPSYTFYPSCAAFLGMQLHLQALCDEQNQHITELKDLVTELTVPSLVKPFPVKALPIVLQQKEWTRVLFRHARLFREVKGIIVNTFMELESYAVESFSNGKLTNVPPVYTIGPILNLEGDKIDQGSVSSVSKSEIMEWLDDQPPSSVVFLCFGSMGSFSGDQVKEIAFALENSGHRFLWSLRQPPPLGQVGNPTDYVNLTDVLPEGFTDRTVGIGKIIGWAPQISILAHKAIGGFVSHCGWNSVLESVWFGVPIAAWPMYAEQQFNAVEMVMELELAVEIKMDYLKDISGESLIIVTAKQIEKGIKELMDPDCEIRKRMAEMSAKSRKAVMKGGSSFFSMGCLIDEVMGNTEDRI
ncbi:anthocyanidin 3-O-glucosyltransferase 2-like [Mangifera indica]|uniref:anthocyanidin 3-O-glucosyltransferase 2-like n=1 Tax=Mangifera indica TaxID=29780 RepID=UPI001CFBEE6E|nr:anthocyanidin 3-O-glucosyltransferase 2-like [Mangifera indica]XP_044461440.1 anthocyanidin 3-O-glucosyltransferase 2-like [Mangifera indica]XP_044461449.1 anthocyanidin 3-O-glucosyltransferase 2-like [Mangifera indica]XP_044461458.1 anthocyanidin 3-O-glucosyltransferase 2-like [Mangifera indica]